MDKIYKTPRLFMDTPLTAGGIVPLADSAFHYLRNVMRQEEGAVLRLFNGVEGEFIGTLTSLGKKSGEITLGQQIRVQENSGRKIHLLFTPLKKERMDFLIEKSVELGVTDLHPVLTQNTDTRQIKPEKINAQIIEAAEQCERLDLPTLHDIKDVWKTLSGWTPEIPVLAALERYDAKPIFSALPTGDTAFLIGPAGGFTEEEKNRLATLAFVTPVSLGRNILRAETAALAALAATLN